MMTTITWTYQDYIKIIRLNQKIRDLCSKVRWGWLLSHAGNSNEKTACRGEVFFYWENRHGKSKWGKSNAKRIQKNGSRSFIRISSSWTMKIPKWIQKNKYWCVCVCQGAISNPRNIHQPAVFESAQLEHSTLMDISRFWCWKWSKLMKAWPSRQKSL